MTGLNDCISRQAVLDLPKNTERGFGGKILEQSINIEYIKALPPVTPAENVGQINVDVLDKIKADLWMEGMNMTGEYQGVWVRYRDIERIIDKCKAGRSDKI